MRFLADESCDFSVVRALRAEGHDIVAIAEISPREEDDDVRERALKDDRLLITEDKDFGQLVYADMRSTGGVIFIRFPARATESSRDSCGTSPTTWGKSHRKLYHHSTRTRA